MAFILTLDIAPDVTDRALAYVPCVFRGHTIAAPPRFSPRARVDA